MIIFSCQLTDPKFPQKEFVNHLIKFARLKVYLHFKVADMSGESSQEAATQKRAGRDQRSLPSRSVVLLNLPRKTNAGHIRLHLEELLKKEQVIESILYPVPCSSVGVSSECDVCAVISFTSQEGILCVLHCNYFCT